MQPFYKLCNDTKYSRGKITPWHNCTC